MSSPWRGWDRRALGEEQQPDRLARERRPKHQALGEGVKEIRALQDAASKAGEPAPDIAK